MSKKSTEETFQPSDFLKADQHEKDMSGLTKRIEVLEAMFGTHEKIADTLFETAEKQTKMHEMIACTFTKVLKTDDNVKKEVGVVIDGHDRKKFWWITGKIGFGIWSLFLAIVAYILGKIFH